MSVRNGGCGIIQRIAEESGLSISSVYKILNSSSSFSADKRGLVRRLAKQYGYFPREGGEGGGARRLTIGVLIPKYPAYFWEQAARGMRNAAQSMTGVKLNFCYYPHAYNTDDAYHALTLLLNTKCDAYIIYPISSLDWLEFAPKLSAECRTVFFNDMMDGTPNDPFISYIGPDYYEEGITGAYLASERITGMSEIAVLASELNNRQFMLGRRIEGFKKAALEINPGLNIKELVFDVGNKMAAAELARRIKHEYRNKGLDCIYVSGGFMYLACMAVEKLNRTEDSPCSETICIGQEHSPSDDKYLGKGRIYAYVAQDIYLQGYMAVKEAVGSIMMNMPLKSMYMSSSPIMGKSSAR